MHNLVRTQQIPLPRREVFAFFADPHKLELLTPPWLRFRILSVSTPTVESGTEINYRLRVRGVPMRWKALIERFEPEEEFIDLQLHGPYAYWRHQHLFRDCPGGTLVTDKVEYALPLGPLGEVAHSLLVRRDLERIFNFRQEALSRHLLGA